MRDDRREIRSGKQNRTHHRGLWSMVYGLWSVKGFTLIELMVVIVIVGIIAAFGIPSYTKSIQKAHERDMAAQLTAIHAANLLYRSYNGKYWAGVNKNMAEINSALSLNIIANDGTTYNYNTVDGGSTFIATASWGTGTVYTLKVTQVSIASTNPCCQSNNCLSLANCP
ncbi:MAG: prepilin-type N-terminal cleavage/methylation domain-containing protein [Candidatus Omnitrophica bacterium]|nr:prepilin-type N-terminal cleavage/methylation domain-containing protein [Candidatus Omnitrophota bacterium]